MKVLSKKVLLATGVISVTLASFGIYFASFASSLDCRVEKVSETVKHILFPQRVVEAPGVNIKKPEVSVLSSRPVKLGDVEFCEVVYKISAEGLPKEVTEIKQIAYVRGNLYVGPDVRLLENGNVKLLSQERFMELNKDVIENFQAEQKRKEVESIDESIRSFSNVRSYVDVRLGKDKAEVEFVVFVDPLCPHCSRVIEFFEERIKAGKANFAVNYIFAPILGENSRKIVASVICDIKEPDVKVKKLKERYISRNICQEGITKASRNVELFEKTGARGVPFIMVYRQKGESFVLNEVISGANLAAIESSLNFRFRN